MDRFNLAHHHFGKGRISFEDEIGAPVDAGKVVEQVGVRHLVVVRLRVAELHVRVVAFGLAGFKFQNGLGFFLSGCLFVASQFEEVGHVFTVGGTDLLHGIVLFQIETAFAQCQLGLENLYNVLLGVFVVGTAVCADESRHAVMAQSALQHEELFLRLCSVDFFKKLADGSVALSVEACGVHSQTVESAYLLFQRTLCSLLLGEFEDDVA